MNHFPRAFEAYEEKHEVSSNMSFEQLKNSITLWATDSKGIKRYMDTKKQSKALAIEAYGRGIKTYQKEDIPTKGYTVSYKSKSGKTVTYTRGFHIRHIIREIYGYKTVNDRKVSVSGKFVSKEAYDTEMERIDKEFSDEIDETET